MNIQDFYIKTVEPSKYVLAPGENDPFLEICVAEGICTAEGLTQEQADAVETFPPTNGADWGDAKE